MIRLYKKGVNKVKKIKRIKEGYLLPLLTHEKKNGWYYQIDYVRDSRLYKKPTVIVYGFKPPRVSWAKRAEYYYTEE